MTPTSPFVWRVIPIGRRHWIVSYQKQFETISLLARAHHKFDNENSPWCSAKQFVMNSIDRENVVVLKRREKIREENEIRIDWKLTVDTMSNEIFFFNI